MTKADVIQKLRRFRRTAFEEGLHQKPSKYALNSYAEKLLDTIKNWDYKDPENKRWADRQDLEIDIIKADIPGNLGNQKNKGYHRKWNNEREKIDRILGEFIDVLHKEDPTPLSPEDLKLS